MMVLFLWYRPLLCEQENDREKCFFQTETKKFYKNFLIFFLSYFFIYKLPEKKKLFLKFKIMKSL